MSPITAIRASIVPSISKSTRNTLLRPISALSASHTRPSPSPTCPTSAPSPQPFPTRPFSSSCPSFKKVKTAPAKPPKGKVRQEDDPSETDVDLKSTLAKVKTKIDKPVDWARAQVYDGVERARGRISPAILDGIKVNLKDSPSTPLASIASVTLKQNTLYVDVWDTNAIKHVESALNAANLPGISPQRVSDTSIKIPVSRPTQSQRQEILRSLGQTIESAKNQVRAARADGLKLVGGKGAQGADEVQKLANDAGGELDGLLGTAKKELEK